MTRKESQTHETPTTNKEDVLKKENQELLKMAKDKKLIQEVEEEELERLKWQKVNWDLNNIDTYMLL